MTFRGCWSRPCNPLPARNCHSLPLLCHLDELLCTDHFCKFIFEYEKVLQLRSVKMM
ncbi:hypothetical protein KSS87_016839 [Heliosperma pusillum]|nr:hypothetical protein KSS87_016839 [Heliosperma pusillum]